MSRVLAVAFIAVSTMCLSSSAVAQDVMRPRFGAIGGVNFTSVTESDDGNIGIPGINAKVKRRTGFQIGAYFTQPIGSRISVQPEVHYIQKGAEFDAPLISVDVVSSSNTASIGVRQSYLEVPLLLRADFTTGDGIRPFVVAGPSFAYSVSCSTYIKVNAQSLSSDCDTSDLGDGSESPFEKFDAGGIVGGGLAAVMNGRSVSLQVRYARGFTKITKNSTNGYSPKNTGLSVLLGIGI